MQFEAPHLDKCNPAATSEEATQPVRVCYEKLASTGEAYNPSSGFEAMTDTSRIEPCTEYSNLSSNNYHWHRRPARAVDANEQQRLGGGGG